MYNIPVSIHRHIAIPAQRNKLKTPVPHNIGQYILDYQFELLFKILLGVKMVQLVIVLRNCSVYSTFILKKTAIVVSNLKKWT